MLCFEITINGTKMCTVGIDSYGVVSGFFGLIKRPPQPDTEGSDSDEPYFRIGGLVGDIQLEWLDGILELGDEVTIRFIESNEVDTPVKQHRESPEKQKEYRRKFYEQCKLEFENK